MERFKVTKILGDGTYGIVTKAVIQSSGEVVAIKKMKQKFYSWEECLDLREISVLRKVTHSHIVKLKEVVRANDELHLIFEYCDRNLVQLIQEHPHPLEESVIKGVLQQCLQGLDVLHKAGFFHRDIKPENILETEGVYKIADFGLAKEIRSQPPYTEYVSTRWYRAPEVLLRASRYSYQVDIFALGCIMAELYIGRPLFGGTNEIDQITRICSVLGTPVHWPDAQRYASAINYCFPQYVPTPIGEILNRASPLAVDLLEQMLRWDPATRPSAEDCLKHPFFARPGHSFSVPRPQLQLTRNLSGNLNTAEEVHLKAASATRNRMPQKTIAPRPPEGLRNFGASLIMKPPNGIGQGRHRF